MNNGNRIEQKIDQLKERISFFEKLIFKLYSKNESHTPRVYIFGVARSGTTLIKDILNSSLDFFIFSEFNIHVLRLFPDLYAPYGGKNFIEHFLNRKKSEVPGTTEKEVLPRGLDFDDEDPRIYFDASGLGYRFIGDKIAISPEALCGYSHLACFEELLTEEKEKGIDTTILFTWRRPSENLFGVLKMFPDSDSRQWLKLITETMIFTLNRLLLSSSSFILFQENVTEKILKVLEKKFKAKFPFENYKIVNEGRKAEGFLFHHSLPELKKLDRLYDEIYAFFEIQSSPLKFLDSAMKRSKINEFIKSLEGFIEAFECTEEVI